MSDLHTPEVGRTLLPEITEAPGVWCRVNTCPKEDIDV